MLKFANYEKVCQLMVSMTTASSPSFLSFAMQSILTNVTLHLNKVAMFQQFFRAREARHRYSVEGKKTRVFWWSLVNCAVVITVGIIQVVLVRNLFKTRRQDKIRT